MPRGRHHGDPHPVSDGDDVTITHRHPVEGDLVVGVEVVRGAGRVCEGVAAGDVVVVDVRLEHVRDAHTRGGGECEDAVDVALRIHNHRHRAVVGEVAAVAQRRGVDRNDGQHPGSPSYRQRSWAPVTIGRPVRAQPPVPPATEYASMPRCASRPAPALLRLPDAQMT